MDRTGMDTGRCVISQLLALKDASDAELLDQVYVVGERAARHMLFDEATRLQHHDLPKAMACSALADRIDRLIPPA